MTIKYAEIVMQCLSTVSGQNSVPILNVFVYKSADTVLTHSKSALDTIFQSTVAVTLMSVLSDSVDQEKNRVRWIDDATDAYQDFTHAVAGSITGDPLPTLTCATIQLKSGLRGRSFNGSKHFGVLGESQAEGSELTAAAVTAWGAVVTDMGAVLTDSVGIAWTPVILSRKLSQLAVNPTNVAAVSIASAILNSELGTMRRRATRRHG